MRKDKPPAPRLFAQDEILFAAYLFQVVPAGILPHGDVEPRGSIESCWGVYDLKTVQLAVCLLRDAPNMAGHQYWTNSYGLKHRLEELLNDAEIGPAGDYPYFSNGSVILAAYLLGIPIERRRPPNAFIGVSNRYTWARITSEVASELKMLFAPEEPPKPNTSGFDIPWDPLWH